jgi:hypothetical protein
MRAEVTRTLLGAACLAVSVLACGGEEPAPKAPPPQYAQPYPQQPGYAPQQYGQQQYPQQQPGYSQQPVSPQQPGVSQPATSDRYAAARKVCLDESNAYRARLGLPPLVARPDKAACSDTDARGDATAGTVHGGSGQCGLSAQNECPGWPGPADGMVKDCLKSMFDEGPGEPYSAHGHFINMTNKSYRGLECGFYEAGGKVWLVQNYFM